MNASAQFPYNIQNESIILPMPKLADIQVTRDCVKHLEYGKEFHEPKRVILDTDQEFQLSSVNFGFMMTIHKFCEANGLELRLVCSRPKVLQMFDLLKIAHIFKVYPDLNSALLS